MTILEIIVNNLLQNCRKKGTAKLSFQYKGPVMETSLLYNHHLLIKIDFKK